MKTIPTTFDAVTFRSRTEARWAVFFNECGIDWEYEPEGFRLDCGWYVPDFWLPSLGCFIEIKPRESSGITDVIRQIGQLHIETGFPSALICGSPCDATHEIWLAITSETDDSGPVRELLHPGNVYWALNARTEKIVLHAMPLRGDRVFLNNDGTDAFGFNGHSPTVESELLINAIASARSKCFWNPPSRDVRAASGAPRLSLV